MVPIFIPNATLSSYDVVEKRFYNILCPVFVKHYYPYLSIIKGSIFYKLFRDIEHNLYNIEDMFVSGQIDKYTQLINSEAKRIRLNCASSLNNEIPHTKSKKKFNYDFDENEFSLCYRCKEYWPKTAYISVYRNRLAKLCFLCRNQPKACIYTHECSKCI